MAQGEPRGVRGRKEQALTEVSKGSPAGWRQRHPGARHAEADRVHGGERQARGAAPSPETALGDVPSGETHGTAGQRPSRGKEPKSQINRKEQLGAAPVGSPSKGGGPCPQSVLPLGRPLPGAEHRGLGLRQGAPQEGGLKSRHFQEQAAPAEAAAPPTPGPLGGRRAHTGRAVPAPDQQPPLEQVHPHTARLSQGRRPPRGRKCPQPLKLSNTASVSLLETCPVRPIPKISKNRTVTDPRTELLQPARSYSDG